ncbi:hypothetical protein [Thermoactinomyces mirandus]|uniref:Uncharacterized protein n=1 Tax=Thermoactinomyces mirandus TaxID=2756294 RepID=A0A7W1XUJ7_9BACL|nr:hypothetical protein [Thermoactinomyces mirandus]MBA4603521.1 hypothetical protein [Thermoactinomyces mirandus]
MEGVKINSPEYCRISGHTFGFPPKSIEYFVKCWDMEQKGEDVSKLKKGKLGINCSGFMFVIHIDIFVEDIMWMWETYKHPEAVKYETFIRYKKDYFYVKFGDVEYLIQVENEIRERMATDTEGVI